jgi:hypothetical protein
MQRKQISKFRRNPLSALYLLLELSLQYNMKHSQMFYKNFFRLSSCLNVTVFRMLRLGLVNRLFLYYMLVELCNRIHNTKVGIRGPLGYEV